MEQRPKLGIGGKMVQKFMALSSLRKVFVGLSLISIPNLITHGFAEQAGNVLNGVTTTILWFTAAALNTTLFYWAWEEITELKPATRRISMIILGVVTVAFLHQEVDWAMTAAQDAAYANEVRDASDGMRDIYEHRLFAQLLHTQNQSPSTEDRLKPTTPATVVSKEPSFVYVVPGVWLNNNIWDFLVRHHGPDPVNNIEIVFDDLDRHKQVASSNQPFSVDSLSKTLQFEEIDQVETFHAKQFLWTPVVPDRENYMVYVSSRQGRFSEDLRIEGTNRSNWQYAMKVTDVRSGKIILNCKDPNFTENVEKLPRCFPELVVYDAKRRL